MLLDRDEQAIQDITVGVGDALDAAIEDDDEGGGEYAGNGASAGSHSRSTARS